MEGGFFEIIRSYSTDKISYSYQKQRTRAYDVDLHWRVIYQRKALGMTLETVARNLGVAVATVYRTEKLFDDTGEVCKRKYPPDHGNKKLTDRDGLLVLEILLERPATYFKEIQLELIDRNATYVDVSTICRFLHKKLRMDLQGSRLSDMSVLT